MMTRFDVQSADRIVAAVRRSERSARLRSMRRGRRTYGPSERILAVIQGNAAIDANRWRYAWAEVELDGDDLGVKTGGRSGSTTADYAVNAMESNNTAAIAHPGVDLTTIVPGFSVQPVSTGAIVELLLLREPSTGVYPRYVFEVENAIDGTCEELGAAAHAGKITGDQSLTDSVAILGGWATDGVTASAIYTPATTYTRVKVNGTYRIGWSVSFERSAGSGASAATAILAVNRTATSSKARSEFTASATQTVAGSAILELTADDDLTIEVQRGLGTATMAAVVYGTTLSIDRLVS